MWSDRRRKRNIGLRAGIAFTIGGVMSLTGIALAAAADNYPNRPVRLIIPFGPAAATDIIARVVAAKLSENLGQTIVADNRPGAGGLLGTELAAKAAPDGYTVFVFGINQTIAPALYKKLPYDVVRDFAHISLYGKLPNILVIHPSVPAKSVKEFIAVAKAKPGGMQYGSSGIGASPHLTMELFKTRTGINLVHVPYKVASQGITELLGGNLHAWFNNLPSAIGNVKSGRLRGLAVTSVKRAGQLPDVPTMMEAGVPDFEVTVWQGLAVPVATRPAVVDRLHAAMVKTLADPDLKQKLFDQGFTATTTSRQEFDSFIKSELVRWAKVVRDSGATLEQ